MSASDRPEVPYLLDTSAVLAYLLNEPQAKRIADLHRESAIPFIALSELYAAIWLRFDQAKADEVIATVQAWSLPWVWPTKDVVFLAGRWRAIYRLGLADSYITALAFSNQMTLVTKDSDFRTLQSELRLIYLGSN